MWLYSLRVGRNGGAREFLQRSVLEQDEPAARFVYNTVNVGVHMREYRSMCLVHISAALCVCVCVCFGVYKSVDLCVLVYIRV